jgi:hypothetical protein
VVVDVSNSPSFEETAAMNFFNAALAGKKVKAPFA